MGTLNSLAASPAGKKARLLVVNNMPAFYRTEPFRSLIEAFEQTTGGIGAVAYQVRRDPSGRGEWFYTPDSELPYPAHFTSRETRASAWRTGYPVAFDLSMWQSYRPTHVFAAGWDCPLSVAAAARARVTRSRLGFWVESNQGTSTRRGRVLDGARRAVLNSADFVVVPTQQSAELVHALGAFSPRVVELKNSVTWQRLPDGDEQLPRRLVFLGDLSRRKGFDYLIAIAREGRTRGWETVAWGRDVEGLAAQAEGVLTVESPAPLAEIVPQLRASDVLIIPSRVDPAPLTYSEGLALGLRVMVSDQIAYGDDAALGEGTASISPDEPAHVVATAADLMAGDRPSASRGDQVSPGYWARGVLKGLLE